MVFYQIRFFLWIAENWITDLKLMQILIQAHSFCEVNIYIHRGGLYIKEHLGFLQLINFLTCRVGVGVIFIKSTKSVNLMLKMPQMAGYHGVGQQTCNLKCSWGTIWILKVNNMIYFLFWILDALETNPVLGYTRPLLLKLWLVFFSLSYFAFF